MTEHHELLIVDDDIDQREPLALLLESKGYTVVTADSADAALALLRGGRRPCVIILDLMMPVRSGEDFRQEQLRDPALAPIPVLLYSAGTQLHEAAARIQAVGHVAKPHLGLLFVLIDRHC